MSLVSTKSRTQAHSSDENLDESSILASFGVGCFHFGQRKVSAVDEFDVEKYVNEVRVFLSHYTNIESISAEDLRYTKLWVLDNEEYDNASGWLLNDSDGIRPWPVSWKIEFVIQIPERIQEQILSEFSMAALETNRFRVSILYEDDLPVAIVRGEQPISKPSDAVILIREYLKRNIPKDSPIDFQLLGPSPFHADFYVFESDSDAFERVVRPGYDGIYFSTTKNIQDFFSEIEVEVTRELGLFYAAIQRRNILDAWWGEYVNQVGRDIESLRQSRGLVRRIKDFVTPPEFNDRALELVEYEIMVASEMRSYAKRLKDNTMQYGLDRFSSDVEDVMATLNSREVDQFRAIIGVLDSHRGEVTDYRISLIAAFIGLIAACVGGAVGALITLHAGGGSLNVERWLVASQKNHVDFDILCRGILVTYI